MRAAFLGYNYVIDGRELKPPYVATGFVTLRLVIAKRPNVISSFMHATAESLKIMMKDRELAYRLESSRATVRNQAHSDPGNTRRNNQNRPAREAGKCIPSDRPAVS